MSDTPNLDRLREEVRRLAELLDDPHPGLSAWRESLASCLTDVARWAPRKQLKLFPEGYNLYGGGAPHVKGSDTSAGAARAVQRKLVGLLIQVLLYIARCGERGATCSEVEIDLRMSHQNASARLRELVIYYEGTKEDPILVPLIYDTGRRRKSHLGFPARVYRITQDGLDRLNPTALLDGLTR